MSASLVFGSCPKAGVELVCREVRAHCGQSDDLAGSSAAWIRVQAITANPTHRINRGIFELILPTFRASPVNAQNCRIAYLRLSWHSGSNKPRGARNNLTLPEAAVKA